MIAGLVANALLYGYEQYRDRMVGQPLPLPRPATAAPGSDAAPPEAAGSADPG